MRMHQRLVAGRNARLVHRLPIHSEDLKHGRVLVLLPVVTQADAHAIEQPVRLVHAARHEFTHAFVRLLKHGLQPGGAAPFLLTADAQVHLTQPFCLKPPRALALRSQVHAMPAVHPRDARLDHRRAAGAACGVVGGGAGLGQRRDDAQRLFLQQGGVHLHEELHGLPLALLGVQQFLHFHGGAVRQLLLPFHRQFTIHLRSLRVHLRGLLLHQKHQQPLACDLDGLQALHVTPVDLHHPVADLLHAGHEQLQVRLQTPLHLVAVKFQHVVPGLRLAAVLDLVLRPDLHIARPDRRHARAHMVRHDFLRQWHAGVDGQIPGKGVHPMLHAVIRLHALLQAAPGHVRAGDLVKGSELLGGLHRVLHFADDVFGGRHLPGSEFGDSIRRVHDVALAGAGVSRIGSSSSSTRCLS